MALSLALLGKRLKAARESRTLTQEQLAEAMDISSSQISKMERGQSQPSLTMLSKICDYLGAPLEMIICGASITSVPDQNRLFVELIRDCDEQTIDAMLDICQRIKALSMRKKESC